MNELVQQILGGVLLKIPRYQIAVEGRGFVAICTSPQEVRQKLKELQGKVRIVKVEENRTISWHLGESRDWEDKITEGVVIHYGWASDVIHKAGRKHTCGVCGKEIRKDELFAVRQRPFGRKERVCMGCVEKYG
jgi:hypothetical protein